MFALTWDDIDTHANSVVISKNATRVKGIREMETTKTNKARGLDVDIKTMAALRAHRAARPKRDSNLASGMTTTWCSAALTEHLCRLTLLIGNSGG